MQTIAEATLARHRPRRRARRLGRPEPVDGARRRGRDPRRLRARVRQHRRSRAAASRWSASAASAAGSPSCSPRAAPSSCWPTSTTAAASSPTGSAPRWTDPRVGADGRRRRAGAVRARRRAQRRDRPAAALPARSPAPPTTSSPHEAVGELLAARGILWVPDFVANAGGVVNIAVELEPEGYDTARAETRVRAIADTVRTVLDHAEATGATPRCGAGDGDRPTARVATRRVAPSPRQGRPWTDRPRRLTLPYPAADVAALGAQLLQVRPQRDRGERPQLAAARRPTRRRAARPRSRSPRSSAASRRRSRSSRCSM